jgi:hypothetical protein
MRIGVNGTHARAEGCHVGHELQLMALSSELGMHRQHTFDAYPCKRVFYISGQPGIGKRTFVERLWDNMAKLDTPRILFKLDPKLEIPIDEQLKTLAVSNQSYFDWLLEQLAGEIEDQTHRYNESGKTLPQIGRLALWSGLVQQRIVENPDVQQLQIIFVIHDYSLLPELHRKLLARAIPPDKDNVDVRIIATGSDESETAEIDDVFFDRAPTTCIQLPPITLKDVEKWLYSRELPIEFANELLERSGGLPGKLEKVCETIMLERGREIQAGIAENALSEIKDDLRQYVCMASLLPETSRDTLRAILPDELAQTTLAALRECNWPDSRWNGESFVFGHRVGRALQSYLENTDARTFEEVRNIAAQLAEINAAIPASEDRAMLTRLLDFYFFNRHALLEIMPEAAEATFGFATHHLDTYFERSGGNLRIRPRIREITEKYVSLTHQTTSGYTRLRIQQLWTRRKKFISDSIAKCAKNLDRDTAMLIAVKQHLSETEKRSARYRPIPVETRQSACVNDTSDDHSYHTRIIGLLMQGIGTCVLYFCLLSSSPASILYAAFGLTLIVSGLFTDNCRSGRHAKTDDINASTDSYSDNNNIAPYENNALNEISETRCELEMKQAWLASKIAGEKIEMRHLVKELEEPYIHSTVRKL